MDAADTQVVRMNCPWIRLDSRLHSLRFTLTRREPIGVGGIPHNGLDAVLLSTMADRLNALPDMVELLRALIAQPSELRIVMASRGWLDLPLARHEANGNLLRITPDAMLFDKDEQAAVIERLGEVRVPSVRGRTVLENLAGWPLGVGLQVRCASQDYRRAGISADLPDPMVKGTWRLIEDYFQQEVMSSLSTNTSFLVQASILPQWKSQMPRTFGAKGRFAALAHQGAAMAGRSGAERLCDPAVFRQFLRPA